MTGSGAAARLDDAHAAADEAITAIDEARKKQAAAPGLAEPARKALATPDREWDGPAAHRDYPMVSPSLQGKQQTKGKIMRIFVTGATGALGRHLVPGLVAAGGWTSSQFTWAAALDQPRPPADAACAELTPLERELAGR